MEEDNMQGLLYPAYQKLYNSLCFLERLNKESDFYDNIACLDGFFSEYRNITFVMQSQLKHTDYYEIYEKNRDIYLTDHWFVEKRNQTTKQHPFQLVKKIKITVYTPLDEITVTEREFSIDNDIPLKTLLGSIKEYFLEFREVEVFFSVFFSLFEKNSDIDLVDKILTGITNMKDFLNSVENEIGAVSEACNQLKEKINKMIFINVPRDFLLTDDYVYYVASNRFEKAGRWTMLLSLNGEKVANRRLISEMKWSAYFNIDDTIFGKFTLMHATLRIVKPGVDIMPAIMIIYDDDTYDLDAFHADIKTTIYRKLNEAAKIVEKQGVKEVLFVTLYAVFPLDQEIPINSCDRIIRATSDILVCASIDNQLNEKEYVFDGGKIENPEYVRYVMKNELKNELEISRTNMFPIWQAFSKKENTYNKKG